MLYYDENITFRTCSCNDTIAYSIEHHKKPLPLPAKLQKAIETILWYAPNEASSQSLKNDYLEEKQYDKAIINYFLGCTELKSEDVLFVHRIPRSILNTFLNKACPHCKKIIVVDNPNQTKIITIMKHLRNCIAHGNFNLVDGIFVGYDQWPDEPFYYTALFNLDIATLYEFCIQLIRFPDFTISQIFQYAFEKKNYAYLGTLHKGRGGKGEEYIFVRANDKYFRVNCSRYRSNTTKPHIRNVPGYKIVYDFEFNENTNYISVYYCEKIRNEIYKVNENNYLINKEMLSKLYDNRADLTDILL